MMVETVLLRGIFTFLSNVNSSFQGPIKRGFRPVVWLESPELGATSASFISEIEILPGSKAQVEIVILNQKQLNKPLVKGETLYLGSISAKIGEFLIEENLGIWSGRVP